MTDLDTGGLQNGSQQSRTRPAYLDGEYYDLMDAPPAAFDADDDLLTMVQKAADAGGGGGGITTETDPIATPLAQAAQTAADNAVSAASSAQSDATQALTDSATAQSTADQNATDIGTVQTSQTSQDSAIAALQGTDATQTTDITTIQGQVPPAGGDTDQILSKIDGTDYNTEWVDAPAGGGITVADGVSGYHRIDEWRPASPEAINGQDFVTGFDLNLYPDAELRFTFTDSFNGTTSRQWPVATISVVELLAAFAAGVAGDAYLHVWDDDYITINVTDVATGTLNITDTGRDMAISSIEWATWAAPPQRVLLGEELAISDNETLTIAHNWGDLEGLGYEFVEVEVTFNTHFAPRRYVLRASTADWIDESIIEAYSSDLGQTNLRGMQVAGATATFQDEVGFNDSIVRVYGLTSDTSYVNVGGGADGADGQGVEPGGTIGQVLAKIDGTDYNTEWVDVAAAGVPDGGTTGQVLAKASDVDGDATWVDDLPVILPVGFRIEWEFPTAPAGDGDWLLKQGAVIPLTAEYDELRAIFGGALTIPINTDFTRANDGTQTTGVHVDGTTALPTVPFSTNTDTHNHSHTQTTINNLPVSAVFGAAVIANQGSTTGTTGSDSHSHSVIGGDAETAPNHTIVDIYYVARATSLATIGAGGADDQTAAEVAFTPDGSVASTDVQGAIGELGVGLVANTAAAAAAQATADAVPDVIDEDDFVSDSATRPPSQQSVKAYVDALIAPREDREARGVYLSTDFGVGSTGVNAAFAQGRIDFPAVMGSFQRGGVTTANSRLLDGGFSVLVPHNVHDVTSTISMGPGETLLLGGTLRAAGGFSGDIIDRDDTVSAAFAYDKMAIIGVSSEAQIDGSETADNGVHLWNVDNFNMGNVRIRGCTGDALWTEFSQHGTFNHIEAHSNGGWAFRLSATNTDNGILGSDTNQFNGCVAFENGAGGYLVEAGVNNTFAGCDAKFHENGPGVRIQGQVKTTVGEGIKGASVNRTKFTGMTFESNLVHAEVLSSDVNGTIMHPFSCELDGYFIISPGSGTGSGVNEYDVNRFLVNQGMFTKVSGTSFNNSNQWPADGTVVEDPFDVAALGTETFNSTGGTPLYSRALFEQDAARGGLLIDNFVTPRGGGTNRLPLVCDFDGNLLPEDNTSPVVQVNGGFSRHLTGAGFPNAAYYGHDAPAGDFAKFKTESGDYVGVLQDAGLTMLMDDTVANEFTIPGSGFVDYPTGTVIYVVQANTGVTSIDPGGGVTVNGGTATIALSGGVGSSVTLRKTAQDVWFAG